MSDVNGQIDLKELIEESRRNLYFFAKAILGFDWLNENIHLPLTKELEDLSKARKCIVLPRGWLKTTLCSISFPMWLSIQDYDHLYHGPNTRILIVQNSAKNACKKLAVIRQQWEGNSLLRAMFPELLPGTNSTWNADALCLTRRAFFPEATYEAAGTSTRVTSRHYDVVIEDDTVAPDYDELGNESLAPSTDDVDKAIGWHTSNVIPLLNRPLTDLNLVVGTRWYDQDLIRYVMDNEPDYQIITRASKEDEEGKPSAKGKVTYPERFPEKVLREIEIKMGPYMYNCLYMNTPVRSEDMAFKMSWFQYYELMPAANRLAIYTTVDPATDPKLSVSGEVDYSVVMTCAKDMSTGLIYVLDYFRKQCNPGELASAIFDHVTKYRPVLVGYENVAYQKSIEYWLKELMRQEQTFFVLQPLKLPKTKGAKDMRILGLVPLFASGSILIRTWMKELESELIKFPLGENDDLPDALSMQLALWKMTKAGKQLKLATGPDPFSYESMLEELKNRKRPGLMKSIVAAPANTSSMFFTGRSG